MSAPASSASPHPETGHAALRQALHSVLLLLRGVMLLLVLVYLFSGVTIVGAGQVALVERLGRLQKRVHPPGLVWAWPGPIDRVLLLPGRQVLELSWEEWAPQATNPEGLIAKATLHPARDGYTLTGDKNILQGRFSARYRVDDPAAYFQRAENPELALREILGQSLTQALASARVDDVLSDGRAGLALTALELSRQTLQKLDLGVELLALEIRELVPPAWVFSAFEEVIHAQVEAETEVENALNEKARILPESEAQARRILAEAEAASGVRVLQAEAAASTFRLLQPTANLAPEAFRARRMAELWQRLAPRWQNALILPQSAPLPALWLPGKPRPGFEPSLPTQPANPVVSALSVPLESLEEWEQLPQ